MKQKVSLKNIIAGTSLMLTLTLLVFIDYQRVQKDFSHLKTKLNEFRMESLMMGKNLVIGFKENEMSATVYKTNQQIESMKISTLHDVQYDTVLGIDTIVFYKGTTSAYNKRIHGGEISLRSWLGFTKYIHINCAGYVREGQYPED